MSWHCSRALVVAFSAATSSAGALSALSNSTPMPDQFYWPDKTTEHSRLSRFGMTCEPLTADLGAALLTWFLEASRVKTSAQLAKVTDSTVSVPASGRKWLGSLAKFDPDSRSWRTAQFSLLGGSEEFSATWPRSGSMRNGECSELMPWEPPTSANESGFWPTPNCIGFRSDGELRLLGMMASSRTEYEAMSHRACRSKKDAWFPTATATASKGWSANHNRAQTDDRLDYTIEREAHNAGIPGRLNPDWTEWLMGWPIGLTELKPLETAKFREWQQQHGACSEAP